jgi:hypothetical protein
LGIAISTPATSVVPVTGNVSGISATTAAQAAAGALSAVGEALLDILVPRAEAQDALVSSAFPTAFFDDTDTLGVDWTFVGDQLFASIGDPRVGTTPMLIESSPNNHLSFHSDPAGNVSVAQDSVFVERSSGRVSVGTINPTALFHVFSNSSTAKILAEETNAAVAPRNMFELINNGPIGFNMTDTNVAQTWRFAAQPTGFRVSLDGTGGPEVEVGPGGTLQVGPGGTANLFFDAAGNLTVVGTATATAHLTASDRNLKENFVALEGGQVLAKITALPVTEWSFKGDPVRRMIEERDARIVELERRLADVDAREARLQALEAAVSQLLAGRPAEKLAAALTR